MQKACQKKASALKVPALLFASPLKYLSEGEQGRY
jgi:hypothetical protein